LRERLDQAQELRFARNEEAGRWTPADWALVVTVAVIGILAALAILTPRRARA